MKFKDLYEKGLERKVNPAVSASDLSDLQDFAECQGQPR